MTVSSWKQTLFIALAVLLCLPSSLRAQVQNGSVTGLVTDPSGAVIPKAQVEATDEASGIHFTAITTSSGEYAFPRLPVGSYTLSVTAQGFTRTVWSHVQLEVAQRRAVDFHLSIGSAAQTVQATSTLPGLQTQSASPG